MTTIRRNVFTAVALALATGACAQGGSSPSAQESASPAAAPQPSASRDPAVVLDAWAKAVEARKWPLVRSYWGQFGEMSGMTAKEFTREWDKLSAPRVSLGLGDAEGAAGSSFYTAPVTITDGTKSWKGEITLRRVNDVPGATQEDLRWHIEKSTLPF